MTNQETPVDICRTALIGTGFSIHDFDLSSSSRKVSRLHLERKDCNLPMFFVIVTDDQAPSEWSAY